MKAIVSKTMQKKKIKKLIIICAAAAVVLLALLVICLKLTWRPTVLEKDSFTEEEKAVIAQQLHIPDESITIKHMKFSHAKDSYFCIRVETDDAATIGRYESPDDPDAEEPVYIKRDEEDPHGDITCTVKSKEPYMLDFELHTWNKELYEIVKE